MRIGLTLEGGGMRGMYTAGVIDVMMENNIRFDIAVGVSAGALFGCNYKSHQIGRVIRYNKRFCQNKRYASIQNWIKTGDLYNKEFAYHIVPSQLDVFDTDTFAKDPMEFYVVCTNADTGLPVYHKCDKGDYDDIEWMRASGAIPIVFKMVNIDGQKYVDGGVSDSIPVRWMKKQNVDKQVVVLTRPLGYRKKLTNNFKAIALILKSYPRLVETLKNRHIMYNNTLEEIAMMEKNNEAFVIRPSSNISLKTMEKDPDRLEEVYQLGRKDMLARLDELKEYIKK